MSDTMPMGMASAIAISALFVAMTGAQADTVWPEPRLQPIAYFTDNGDRTALGVLRRRKPAELTDQERAILLAANRVGWIEIGGCNRGSNAILINVDGRDAVVTSRHLLAGTLMGQFYCDLDAAARFYPNASYLEPGQNDAEAAFAVDRVPLQPNPLNLEGGGLMMGPESDWLLYYLEEDISDAPMPDGTYGAGSARGAVRFADRFAGTGTSIVIGFDGRFSDENGMQSSFQECRYIIGLNPWEPIFTDCDAAPGASSSLLATMEAGELVFLGMISRVSDRLAGTDVPTPAAALLWNQAVRAVVIREALAQD